MRRPTTISESLAWHRAAMAGERPPVHDGQPQCGWFKRKLVKGGPWVPVRIYLERDICPDTGDLASDERLRCTVEGIDGGNPADHWTYLTPITREQYVALIDAPLRDSRMADTTAPIDLTAAPTLPKGYAYAG